MSKRETYGTSVQKIFTSCLFQLPRRKQVFLPHWFWIHSYAFLWLVSCETGGVEEKGTESKSVFKPGLAT